MKRKCMTFVDFNSQVCQNRRMGHFRWMETTISDERVLYQRKFHATSTYAIETTGSPFDTFWYLYSMLCKICFFLGTLFIPHVFCTLVHDTDSKSATAMAESYAEIKNLFKAVKNKMKIVTVHPRWVISGTDWVSRKCKVTHRVVERKDVVQGISTHFFFRILIWIFFQFFNTEFNRNVEFRKDNFVVSSMPKCLKLFLQYTSAEFINYCITIKVFSNDPLLIFLFQIFVSKSVLSNREK